eukprot:IDg2039t1
MQSGGLSIPEDNGKLQFFEKEVPHKETIVAHFGNRDIRVYLVNRPIIDTVIQKYSLALMETLLTPSQTCCRKGMRIHTLYVAGVAHVARTFGHVPNMSGVYEGAVQQIVQAVVAVNLQNLHILLCDKRAWCFSIAFDAGTNHGDSFIDVRVSRICQRGYQELSSAGHPRSRLAHRGAVFDVIREGAVTPFQNACLLGFYRIWCGAHQLDLLVQALMTGCLKNTFRMPLVSVIAFLRRQYGLRQEMGTTCPAISTTRWSSLGAVTRWLVRHRERISEYIETKQPTLAPTAEWWAFASAIKSLMDPLSVREELRHSNLVQMELMLSKKSVYSPSSSTVPWRLLRISNHWVLRSAKSCFQNRGNDFNCIHQTVVSSEFFEIVKQHKQRLRFTKSLADIAKLEDEFKTFKKHVSASQLVLNSDRHFETCTSKGEMCSVKHEPFSKRFKLLSGFCGGLATIFLVSHVECDFSRISLERNDNRSNLTDLSLEGILQSKQFHALRKLTHNYDLI